jgi:ABC-type polysaccharide/polyol phosphate export permease
MTSQIDQNPGLNLEPNPGRTLKQIPDVNLIDSTVSWHNWSTTIRDVIRYRYLLINLVKRDLKVRYRNSVLGVLWSLLNPLFMMLVFSLIFGKLIPREDIHHYHVFFLVGLLPWNFFSGSVLNGTLSITRNSSIIKKVFFPRVLLPMAALLSNLVNFLLAFVVLLFFLFTSGLGLTVHALWLPVLLITQLLFILGLVLILSTLHVFYRDVVMILDVVMLAWFFMTPIIYSLDALGGPRIFLGITFDPAVVMRWINPMASIIDGYRTVLWGTTGSNGAASMDGGYLLRTFITSAVIFLFGFAIFTRSQHLFGEKL